MSGCPSWGRVSASAGIQVHAGIHRDMPCTSGQSRLQYHRNRSWYEGLTCEAFAVGPCSNDKASSGAVFSRNKAGTHFEALQTGIARNPLCIAGQLKGAP